MNPRKVTRALLSALLGISIAGVALLVPGASFAEEESVVEDREHRAHPRVRGSEKPGDGPPARLMRALRRLELDEAQRESVRAILEDARESGEPLRADMRESIVALRDLHEDEEASGRALEEAVDAVLGAREALRLHRVEIKEQIREVLTARQQAQLLLMAERARRGPPRGPKGHPGRRGPGGPR